jgi:hypothetical protein
MNCEFKVGQMVWTIHNGWEEITHISNIREDHYPIQVGGNAIYTACGRMTKNDKFVSLYTYDPIDGTEPPISEVDWDKFERGTVIEVQMGIDADWYRADFIAYCPEYGPTPFVVARHNRLGHSSCIASYRSARLLKGKTL